MNDLVWGVSDPSCISAPSMHSTDYFLEGPVDVVNILAERAISWRTSWVSLPNQTTHRTSDAIEWLLTVLFREPNTLLVFGFNSQKIESSQNYPIHFKESYWPLQSLKIQKRNPSHMWPAERHEHLSPPSPIVGSHQQSFKFALHFPATWPICKGSELSLKKPAKFFFFDDLPQKQHHF